MNEINLSSVNFEHGMLLTPAHLIRMEQYFDSGLLWLLRYTANAHGLIGAGARTPDPDRGAVRHDPVISVVDEESSIAITVSQCRGLSKSGCMIDVDDEHAISARFSKSELDGVAAANIHIVCRPHEKELLDGPRDEWNPQMQTERRLRCSISLQAKPLEQANSLIVGRIRKSPYSAGLEKDPSFIPPCTSMSSHSELMAGWRQIVEQTTQLHERYIALCRAMREFLILFKERGIEAELDAEALTLALHMLSSLESCYYEILDSAQPPDRFFKQMRKMTHAAAVHLDLNPQVQGYFELLRDTGETDFITLLEGQRRVARSGFRLQVGEDLTREIEETLQSLSELRRLERALEGKYLDFRINRSLESMNFVFDRGGRVLYRLGAKPSRTQGVGSDRIVTFAQLKLEGRDKYRIIVVGDRNATFELGTRVTIEIRINEGAGFRRQPVLLSAESSLPEQSNLEFDFEAPDVPIISDLRVTISAQLPVRTALLYVRQRFYSNVEHGEPPARELQTTLPDEPRLSSTVGAEPLYWRRDVDHGHNTPRSAKQPVHSDPADQPAIPTAPPRRRRLE